MWLPAILGVTQVTFLQLPMCVASGHLLLKEAGQMESVMVVDNVLSTAIKTRKHSVYNLSAPSCTIFPRCHRGSSCTACLPVAVLA